MGTIADRPLRVLLLGGTTEASAVAHKMADDPVFAGTLSLAGRTTNPATSPIPVRIGGFGGTDGLAQYLAVNRIDVVIDATHPFAAQISANAIAACTETGVPLLAILRPPWTPVEGDDWTSFESVERAISAIGVAPGIVFSGLGRLSLAALGTAPQHHYVVRVIDPPEAPLALPNVTVIAARGPFHTEDEIELFQKHGIELVLSKNSGGDAAYGKIAAARRLGLKVFMIDRPPIPKRATVGSSDEAMAWLRAHSSPRIERGV